ncbi:MAG: hypothetical protein V4580_06380 [Bacteroidota bacterium]
MKHIIIIVSVFFCFILFSGNKKLYSANGEAIYKTGKNLKGELLLDKNASTIRFIKSCTACHGKNGTRMKGVSIKFIDLSNADILSVPYTDSLFFRFIDHDLKSDGTKANMGVIWRMSNADKNDLLDYLKSL